jgi:hypothetical protein
VPKPEQPSDFARRFLKHFPAEGLARVLVLAALALRQRDDRDWALDVLVALADDPRGQGEAVARLNEAGQRCFKLAGMGESLSLEDEYLARGVSATLKRWMDVDLQDPPPIEEELEPTTAEEEAEERQRWRQAGLLLNEAVRRLSQLRG